MADLPSFVLVMAVTPHGFWRHRGLHFTREWSVVQLGDKLDVLAQPMPLIDAATYAELLASKETLGVKPATPDELAEFHKRAAENRGKDKDAVIADLQKNNADLEARLMKLELAMTGGGKPAKAERLDPAPTKG